MSKTPDPLKRVTITIREELLKRGITKARTLDMSFSAFIRRLMRDNLKSEDGTK